MTTEVLVVGAGPTGLVTALWLTALGVRVRIIDKTVEPGTTSRALAVQVRTLELYDHLGLARDVIERGRRFVAANLWVRGTRAGRIAFGDLGMDLSPFPYALIFPQDEHERVLIAQLAARGVEVERGTTLIDFEDRGDHVSACLRRADGTEERVAAAYVAGCDGAHSTVREILGIGFPGGTYEHLFYVADVEARGGVMDGELHVALDDADFVAVFPLKSARGARFVGTVRPDAERRLDELGWDDVSADALARLGIDVHRLNWFSTYHVHHRVAGRFVKGRGFLLGDAAHIHSPVGGQGMNTGIGDAVNLAWKLAAVLQHKAPPAVLETYEPERIGFARRLVATTDRAFTLVTSRGRLARIVRVYVVPHVLPALFRSKLVRRLMFRTVSQTRVRYRESALSEGRAGGVHGGDRLPWVGDNFGPLSSLAWQIHVYGEPSGEVRKACGSRGLALHVFPWRWPMRRAGLARGALYLVRPDGYVALADRDASVETLEQYLDSRGIRLTPAAQNGGRVT
jgi:2-polyprenyl-6-methoxyphenol hydroxylase-like FAD-dependent oxidoreductase